MRTLTRRFSRHTDVGKILAGIQVPAEETPAFEEWLQSLAYPFVEETDNPVYKDFLDHDEAQA